MRQSLCRRRREREFTQQGVRLSLWGAIRLPTTIKDRQLWAMTYMPLHMLVILCFEMLMHSWPAVVCKLVYVKCRTHVHVCLALFAIMQQTSDRRAAKGYPCWAAFGQIPLRICHNAMYRNHHERPDLACIGPDSILFCVFLGSMLWCLAEYCSRDVEQGVSEG